MKYLLSHSNYYHILNESKVYTIDSRPNHIYNPDKLYWQYKRKNSEDQWEYVENEDSVLSLNSKYKLKLGIFKPVGFSKYKISSRPDYYYKVGPNDKHWQYYKITSTNNIWNYVENDKSVKALNSKYKKNLSPYSGYMLMFSGWEKRAIPAATYLLKAGKSIGMTKMLASALIGNFKVESGIRHNISQSSVKPLKLGMGFKPIGFKDAKNQKGWVGYGLAQWTNDRKNKLIDAGANTINKQLDFVIRELKGTSMWKDIKKAKTLKDATRLVATKYERAGKPNMAERNPAAKYIYDIITAKA